MIKRAGLLFSIGCVPLKVRLLRFRDLQIVINGKDSGHSVRSHGGELFVAIRVDNAFQVDMTVLHQGANRLLHPSEYFGSAGGP